MFCPKIAKAFVPALPIPKPAPSSVAEERLGIALFVADLISFNNKGLLFPIPNLLLVLSQNKLVLSSVILSVAPANNTLPVDK